MQPSLRLGSQLAIVLAGLTSAHSSDVVIPAQDGVDVHGSLHLPEGDLLDPIPGVLLVHGGGQSKEEWAPLLPALEERGWAILAIDLRGHGATGGEVENWPAFFNDADGVPHDVEAAMEFLKHHDSIDAGRIAVVGSSVGGNLACVAVQKYGALGGVSMSGKTAAAESLAGEKLDSLKSMLFIAGSSEQGGARAGWARELSDMSADASRALIVEGSKAHGAALLVQRPEFMRDIIDHLGGVLAAGKRRQVEFPAADGLMVTADMYSPHPVDGPWVVALHQAGWSRGEYRETAPRLNALGFNVLCLDQRSGGAVNDVTNETAARAKERGLASGYLDAEPDILAGLAWVREFGAGKVVLMGSSYSASLALKIAGEHPELVDAVTSFSPGEYFGKEQPKLIETAAAKIACPVFITSAKREAPRWAAMLERIPGEAKRGYVPKVEGQHGSRALWTEFEGSRPLWTALTPFLIAQR